jgi:nucleotide-binding universal stress UspA family protein
MDRPILALIDFSDAAPAVVRTSVELARTQNRPLWLLHVAETLLRESEGFERDGSAEVTVAASPDFPVESEREFRAIRRKLDILELETTRLGVRASTIMLPADRGGLRNPTALILEQIERAKPALVVMGSHGHGRLYQLLIGSMSDKVLRSARCPVVIVPTTVEPEAASPGASAPPDSEPPL